MEARDYTKQDFFDDMRDLTAVDGGYTDWSECSECSVTCGGGTQVLKRTCTNPPPSNGGKDCSDLGPAERVMFCNEQKCCKYF